MLANFVRLQKRRVAGYGHRLCVIPGTKKLRSQFLRKIIGTLLSPHSAIVGEVGGRRGKTASRN